MSRLTPQQRGVLRGMAGALVVTLAVLVLAVTGPWTERLAGAAFAARLPVALGCVAFLLLPLVTCIAALARHRFLTPQDIDGSATSSGTPRATVLQAILQNTLEQTVLAAGAQLAWAAVMPGFALAVLPGACLLFVVGRAAFARGYARGAPHRAFGFALTFYPTVILLVLTVAHAAVAAVRHVG